ncbi:hypothetical protein AB0L59_18320 [Streptomyces sp. NPDC052109]|uniref:hypothetical protein n=1 Tax=Streptomyces sp. NPDC052109 TaxID=3155527 RepID=UPI00343A5009
MRYVVSHDDPAEDRGVVATLIEAGYPHIVLSLRAPCPRRVRRRLLDEIIVPVRDGAR